MYPVKEDGTWGMKLLEYTQPMVLVIGLTENQMFHRMEILCLLY